MKVEDVPEFARLALGDVHVRWLLTHPWGLAVARSRARSCSVRPAETRAAYAAVVDLIESQIGRGSLRV
jgi:hypothetical protein